MRTKMENLAINSLLSKREYDRLFARFCENVDKAMENSHCQVLSKSQTWKVELKRGHFYEIFNDLAQSLKNKEKPRGFTLDFDSVKSWENFYELAFRFALHDEYMQRQFYLTLAGLPEMRFSRKFHNFITLFQVSLYYVMLDLDMAWPSPDEQDDKAA